MANAVAKTEGRELKDVHLGSNIFAGSNEFSLALKMANALSSSTIVPKDYQGNIGNSLIALEMSNRLGTSPLMVMQNLYIVNGRPAWSSQYIIAMINSSKKYKTELQYEITGSGDELSCYAYAEDYNEHRVVGPTITIAMAKKEGWYGKNGSKWPNMPEVMIRYRAASFFGRLNCPDMIMGIYSTDEVVDGVDYQVLAPEQEVAREIENNANMQSIDFEPVNDVVVEKEHDVKVLDPEPEKDGGLTDAEKNQIQMEELSGAEDEPDWMNK